MPAKVPEEVARFEMRSANLEPKGLYQSASKPWECECLICNEIVTPTLLSIRSGQGGCAYCAGKKVNPSKAVELMLQAGYKPLVPYPGSKTPWKSIHTVCGSEVSPKYNSISQRPTSISCKKCSTKFVNPIDAETMMINAGGIPQEPYPGARVAWKCLCLKCNQVVNAHYSTVRKGGGVCRRCALKETARQKRISMDVVVEKCLEVNLKPIVEYTNTDAPLLCECLVCGNQPSPTFTAIRQGIGCRYCSEKATSPEKARRMALKAGLEPLTDFPGGLIPWECRHIKCGQIVYPVFATILKGGSGCISCNTTAAKDRMRFPEDKAIAIMNEAGFKPLVPYVNAVTKWRSVCTSCGNESSPKFNNVQNGSRCIYCASVGFQLNAPAYFYLMFHPELGSHKIGIGGLGLKNDRIAVHTRYGWKLFNQLDFKIGESAYLLEQEILDWVRNELNMPSYLLPEQMPEGGHTETIDASEIDLPTIWAKVEELSRRI